MRNRLHDFKVQAEQISDALHAYHRLHDGLSDMIEGGRLTEADIPDDYQWLVNSLERIGNMEANCP